MAEPQRRRSGRCARQDRLGVRSGAAQKLDLFPHTDPDVPTAIFIHGGFWSRNSKETFRFTVSGIHSAGFHSVFVGHTLAPDASMDEIVDEIRSATRWLFSHLSRIPPCGPASHSYWLVFRRASCCHGHKR